MFDGIDNSNPDRVLAVYQTARGLIERGWTRGDMAVDEHGKVIGALHREAAAWCTVGALHAALGGEVGLVNILDEFGAALGIPGPVVISWNDQPGQTQAAVLRGFDHAIAVRLGTAKPRREGATTWSPGLSLKVNKTWVELNGMPIAPATVGKSEVDSLFKSFVQSVKKHFAHA